METIICLALTIPIVLGYCDLRRRIRRMNVKTESPETMTTSVTSLTQPVFLDDSGNVTDNEEIGNRHHIGQVSNLYSCSSTSEGVSFGMISVTGSVGSGNGQTISGPPVPPGKHQLPKPPGRNKNDSPAPPMGRWDSI